MVVTLVAATRMVPGLRKRICIGEATLRVLQKGRIVVIPFPKMAVCRLEASVYSEEKNQTVILGSMFFISQCFLLCGDKLPTIDAGGR